MPSLKMKTKINVGSLREKDCLHVCQKSSMISKKSCPRVKVTQQATEFDTCILNRQTVSLSMEVSTQDIESDGAIGQQEFRDEQNSWFQRQPSMLLESSTVGKADSISTYMSNLETIFSPSMVPTDLHSDPTVDNDTGIYKYCDVPGLGDEESNDNRRSRDYQTCNVSDFFISDMFVAGLPLVGNSLDADMNEAGLFPDYNCAEPNMLFDVAEDYMILPFLEETARMNDSNNEKLDGVAMMDSDKSNLYLATDQTRSCNLGSDVNSDSEKVEDFDPQLFLKNLPELSDVLSNFLPATLPKEPWKRKPITLVLDLDETLVHSTLEHRDDSDFTFTVFFNMEEHTVYVKKRPHLQTFLQRVAEMFEIIIFTASQSIYAEHLLDILDPEKKFISRRVYRESCIFSDGTYTKDLTVLDVDLAKVAIIDNSPQVFRLQVNNGIPIKSWFDDPSDCALISLLPFLETLVDADDVRPIIAKKFGNKE
ncbi:CTD small phosphatase-like protein 2 [Tripterygium wilfordii]|uniref:CTD small phosphatase-like protein 2 n=1 Tax=Tripterygium wilfordii TaxID=458696 RepID=A0A7J7CWN2_TRIWF|nr:CTD small phosphatase-like protein 2 [Tripterygium wilfordii]KAF5738296.1 CTD small phosphatase-like protein 2 [Tripterygium wilfordii]